MRRGRACLSALCLAAALGLSAGPLSHAAEPPKDPKVFKFGIISPQTGPVSFVYDQHLKPATMAVNEINKAGGIAGIPLEVVYEDNHSGDPKAALSAMNKLISIDKVPLVMVTISSAILATQPVAAENKVLQINTGAWSPALVNKPYLLNIKVTGDILVEGGASAAWAGGARKAAILHPNDAAGMALSKQLQEVWKKWGGEVVETEMAPLGATDFQVHLTKIKAASPDVLFIYFYGVDSGYAIRQAKELGLKIPVYGVLWTPQAAKAAGPAAAGFRYSDDYWDPEAAGQAGKRFAENYAKLYKSTDIPRASINCYDAIYMLKQAVEEARKRGGDYYRGEVLRDVFAKKRFDSVQAPAISFRSNGTCLKSVGVYEVKEDGTTKLLQAVQAKE